MPSARDLMQKADALMRSNRNLGVAGSGPSSVMGSDRARHSGADRHRHRRRCDRAAPRPATDRADHCVGDNGRTGGSAHVATAHHSRVHSAHSVHAPQLAHSSVHAHAPSAPRSADSTTASPPGSSATPMSPADEARNLARRPGAGRCAARVGSARAGRERLLRSAARPRRRHRSTGCASGLSAQLMPVFEQMGRELVLRVEQALSGRNPRPGRGRDRAQAGRPPTHMRGRRTSVGYNFRLPWPHTA